MKSEFRLSSPMLCLGLAFSLGLTAVSQLDAISAPTKGRSVARPRPGDAMALYAKKDYKAACSAFYSRTLADPSDAASYYYLGNCYAALKNYHSAVLAYQRASDIAGGTSVGAASRTAIFSINAIINPQSAPIQKVKVTSDDDSTEGTDKVAKKDPRVTAAETQAQAKIAEGDTAAKKILDEATAKCKPIKQDEDNAVQDIQNNQQARMQNPEAASQILSEVKSPYEDQIKNIMEPAKRRAQELKDAAKRDAAKIKSSALR